MHSDSKISDSERNLLLMTYFRNFELLLAMNHCELFFPILLLLMRFENQREGALDFKFEIFNVIPCRMQIHAQDQRSPRMHLSLKNL